MTDIRATATMHRREMNRTEEKYSKHLQDRLVTGEIRWWAFEAWKFRLADNTYYTPDFIVVDNALRIEAHEVKTWWKNLARSGWTDDARVKIKCAAEMHPVRFMAVTLMNDLSWKVEEFQNEREVPVPTRGDLHAWVREHASWARPHEVDAIKDLITEWEKLHV